jgi:hypothetical protein
MKSFRFEIFRFRGAFMPRRRKKLALATPNEIVTAIYSLTTRGKHARSHIKEELSQIINAAKSQLADYQKGLENHRRHKKRNPNWPSSIRAAAWFAANRREVIDEPRPIASPQTVRTAFPTEAESAAQPAVNGYDLQWARQEAAAQAAEICEQVSGPQPPKPSKPAPPKRGEPGYLKWLLEEADRRGLGRS